MQNKQVEEKSAHSKTFFSLMLMGRSLYTHYLPTYSTYLIMMTKRKGKKKKKVKKNLA